MKPAPPDLIELPVEGSDLKKWVLICNINQGGPFGGSATQYFVGDFDGKKFVNDSPSVTKWMDWGKDHYATVTWSNAPEGRHVAGVDEFRGRHPCAVECHVCDFCDK